MTMESVYEHMRREAFAVTGCSPPRSKQEAVRVVGIARPLEFVSEEQDFEDTEYTRHSYSAAPGFMYSDDNDEKGDDNVDGSEHSGSGSECSSSTISSKSS